MVCVLDNQSMCLIVWLLQEDMKRCRRDGKIGRKREYLYAMWMEKTGEYRAMKGFDRGEQSRWTYQIQKEKGRITSTPLLPQKRFVMVTTECKLHQGVCFMISSLRSPNTHTHQRWEKAGNSADICEHLTAATNLSCSTRRLYQLTPGRS